MRSRGKSTPASTASCSEPQKRPLISMSIGMPVRSSTLYSTIATPCQPKCCQQPAGAFDERRIGGDALAIDADSTGWRLFPQAPVGK